MDSYSAKVSYSNLDLVYRNIEVCFVDPNSSRPQLHWSESHSSRSLGQRVKVYLARCSGVTLASRCDLSKVPFRAERPKLVGDLCLFEQRLIHKLQPGAQHAKSLL